MSQSLGNPSWASSFLPSSLGAVTFNGQLYGVPVEGTQPVYFFYNKQHLRQVPPELPDHLVRPAVHGGHAEVHGVAPISLANGDQWPGLMYLEYLTDRIGGPRSPRRRSPNTAGAWSNPAVTAALTDIQQLARAGGFQTGYDSLKFSGGGSDALVYSGKAAMQLMGDWDISSVLGSDKSFVTGGNLGMARFPAVGGGTGNPADLAGNTASYVAIASQATAAQKKVAVAFLQRRAAVRQLRPGRGRRPARCRSPRAPPRPVRRPAAVQSFDQTIYSSVRKAPELPVLLGPGDDPEVATAMLTNLAQVFELTADPAEIRVDSRTSGRPAAAAAGERSTVRAAGAASSPGGAAAGAAPPRAGTGRPGRAVPGRSPCSACSSSCR